MGNLHPLPPMTPPTPALIWMPPVTPPSGFQQPCLRPQFFLQSFLKIVFTPQENPCVSILPYSLLVLLHFFKDSSETLTRGDTDSAPEKGPDALILVSLRAPPIPGASEKHLCSNCFWRVPGAQRGSSSENASVVHKTSESLAPLMLTSLFPGPKLGTNLQKK